MYHAQPSAHNFSPQRRQILGGANKRLSPAKALLGNDEAITVGPGKLFADLKQQASNKKASSSSNAFGKPKSRAFGNEKNNLSPQRPSASRDAGDVPVKPQNGTAPRNDGKGKGTQLVSPSKVSKKPESIFLASSSPAKRKKKADGVDQKQKTPVLQPIGLDNPADNRPDFVTPEANVGRAGAMRQRLGEMLDAMVQGDLSTDQGCPTSQPDAPALSEEELYPEIEYMPPKAKAPYDFPPELDGLPRGAELGKALSQVPGLGFYKGKRTPTTMPDTIKADPVQVSLGGEGVEIDDEAAFWPDVEVKRSAPTVKSNGQSSSRSKSSPTSISKTTQRPAAPASKPYLTSRLVHPQAGQTLLKAHRSQNTAQSSSRIPKAKKALTEKNGNIAPTVHRTLNPALVDFKNDRMGKIIQQKLAALDDGPAEGFAL